MDTVITLRAEAVSLDAADKPWRRKVDRMNSAYYAAQRRARQYGTLWCGMLVI
jgi:hypothetical protein